MAPGDRSTSHWFLLRQLVRRDLEARYAGSLLGFLWSFAQPLWTLLLFTFIFSTILRVRPSGELTSHFSIFLFGGLLPWMALQEGVMRSATAITDNANLVTKLRFPTQTLVLAVVLAALVHQAIAAVVFVAALLVVGEFAWGGLPLLLLAVPLQVGLTLGLGLLVAALHVFFRDTVQLLGVALQAWFYLTPIVYPLELVPEAYRAWLERNPLAILVDMYRHAFLAGEVRRPPHLLTLVVAVAVLLCAGAWLFRRLKPAFGDEL
jgi:lipopolysaccharide transport system permease protein